MAEASVFLCDSASLAIIGWSRDVDDDDGDAKNSHHLFIAYHKTYICEALIICFLQLLLFYFHYFLSDKVKLSNIIHVL